MRSERVESAPHGAIADRVKAHVELGAGALRDQFDEIGLGQAGDSGAVQHLRGAAAE